MKGDLQRWFQQIGVDRLKGNLQRLFRQMSVNPLKDDLQILFRQMSVDHVHLYKLYHAISSLK